MHLFTITASCRSIVHSSLFADVAAGEGGGGGLNWGWLTAVFLSVCLSVHQSFACRPSGSQSPPAFELSPREMGDTTSSRTH